MQGAVQLMDYDKQLSPLSLLWTCPSLLTMYALIPGYLQKGLPYKQTKEWKDFQYTENEALFVRAETSPDQVAAIGSHKAKLSKSTKNIKVGI